jgi:eukaryotic-like serine/threonine-protein kinase
MNGGVRSFRRSDATTLVDEPAPVVEEEIIPPPPPEAPPPPPRPVLWPWLLLLLLLVAGGLVAAWLLTRDNGHKRAVSTVNVPNVVRLQQQDAVSRLNQRGLVARISTRSGSAPRGTVVAQDPNPGANVTRRSVVTLAVSSAQTSSVPNVIGKTAPAAVQALRAKGFSAQMVKVASKQTQGTVLAETPGAGERVARGSTVTIRISRGFVTVPDVLGQPHATASVAVRRAGLKPKEFVVPSTQQKGIVVTQSPQAGKRVAGGSAVRLNVSSGASGSKVPPPPPPASSPPASVQVPDVTGQQQDAAQKQLNSSGLKAGVVYLKSDEAQGTVVSQSPAGGTAKRGTRVQLNVALGSQPGTLKGVPDVRNLDPTAARSKLTAAGFNVQTLHQGVSDRAQVGKVVDEQLAGGRNAPAGSVITIYVGRASS